MVLLVGLIIVIIRKKRKKRRRGRRRRRRRGRERIQKRYCIFRPLFFFLFLYFSFRFAAKFFDFFVELRIKITNIKNPEKMWKKKP